MSLFFANDVIDEQRRRRWLVRGTAALAVLLLVTGAYMLLNKLADIEAQMGRRVHVSVQQWTSPEFSSGGKTCDAYDGTHSPCACWYSTTSLSSSDPTARECTPLHSIARANLDSVVVLAAGGHDRQDLSPALREDVCCNKQLAFERADLVATVFGKCLEQAREESRGTAARRIEYPVPAFVPSSRGAHDFTSENQQDRTVTITLVRLQESR